MSNLLNRQEFLRTDTSFPFQLTSTQQQQDGVLRNFVSQASDWHNLSAMAAASLAYRMTKLGVISVGAIGRSPLLARLIAPVLGLSSEVTVFRGVNQILSPHSLPLTPHSSWSTDFVNFASLKIFGHISRGHHPILAHTLQDVGMVAGHQLAYGFGFATRPEGTLVDQFVHAEVMNLQMGFGVQLSHLATGGRLSRLERRLDLELQSREISSARQIQLSKAAAFFPLLGSSSTSRLSVEGNFWPRVLEAPQKEFVQRMQAEQLARRETGLLEYYQEVTGESAASPDTFEGAFKTWLGEGRPEFGLSKGDHSDRARYLFIKQMESAAHGIELSSQLLQGVPDAAGHETPLHVEIHKLRETAPKGVIFLLAGYGETLAMQEKSIERFVKAGYVVVGADQRGHGFSGHPLGFEGYMGSPGEALGDAQLVLRSIQENPNLNTLPLFAFGFSQGALLHTLLAQYNPEAYAGFFLVSPTHRLGRRFEFVMPSALETAGKTLADYARLGVDTKSKASPLGNLVEQNFVKFADNSARQVAQKWLRRGFAPPYFLVNDSSVFWRGLIDWALRRGEELGSLSLPAYIVVGSKDDNIGGAGVLENSRLFFDSPITRVYTDKDHQLLLEGEGIAEDILRNGVEFLNRSVASRGESSPPRHLQEIVFHPASLAYRAEALLERATEAPRHLRYVGEAFPSREDFNLLRATLFSCLPEKEELWLSLAGFGVHLLSRKEESRLIRTTLRHSPLKDWAALAPGILELLALNKDVLEGTARQMEVLYTGSEWRDEMAIAVFKEVLGVRWIDRGNRIVIRDESSRAQVSLMRESEKFVVDVEVSSKDPRRFYLLPHARTGRLEIRERLEGKTYPYRAYEEYQTELLAFATQVLGEEAVTSLKSRLELIPRDSPQEYGPLLRAHLLKPLVLTSLERAESQPETFRQVASFIEEAYIHLDFGMLLHLKTQLGAEALENYDRLVLAFNQGQTDFSQRLLPFTDMPLDLPLAYLIPRPDYLRDYFLRHGIFEEPRFLQENNLLLRDPRWMARGAFIPAFKNRLLVLISHLGMLGDVLPEDLFTCHPHTLAAEDLEAREAIAHSLRDFQEFVRILRQGEGKVHSSFVKETLSLIEATYRRAYALLPKIPPSFSKEEGIEAPPSFEKLQEEMR